MTPTTAPTSPASAVLLIVGEVTAKWFGRLTMQVGATTVAVFAVSFNVGLGVGKFVGELECIG